jgi:hypothetical protein
MALRWHALPAQQPPTTASCAGRGAVLATGGLRLLQGNGWAAR